MRNRQNVPDKYVRVQYFQTRMHSDNDDDNEVV